MSVTTTAALTLNPTWFAEVYPPAAWWAATPDGYDENDDGPMDPEWGYVDCVGVSQRFADWMNANGRSARVVEASDADYDDEPLIDFHRWVVSDGLAYDWTVRQYANVEGPAAKVARTCPVPLVWPAHEPHPVLRFQVVRSAEPYKPLTGEAHTG